jgi:hypothetical protein
MSRLLALLTIFRKGAMVSDPTTWKNRQLAINAVFGLVSAAAVLAVQLGWVPDAIATETVQQFSEGLVIAILAIINIVGTAATTKKVGIGPTPHMPEPIDAELFDDPEPVPTQAEHPVGQGGGNRSGADASRDVWLGD